MQWNQLAIVFASAIRNEHPNSRIALWKLCTLYVPMNIQQAKQTCSMNSGSLCVFGAQILPERWTRNELTATIGALAWTYTYVRIKCCNWKCLPQIIIVRPDWRKWLLLIQFSTIPFLSLFISHWLFTCPGWLDAASNNCCRQPATDELIPIWVFGRDGKSVCGLVSSARTQLKSAWTK